MSSNDNLIILLPSIIKILSRYLLPIVLLIGNISCILSLVVFLQKPMRKNPSGLYFLSLTLCNIIFINTTITITILFFGFNIDPTGQILIVCQIQFYIGFVTSLLSSSFLVLTSIDRFITTSSNVNIKRFSTRSIAFKLIFGIIIFSCILHIHSFFFIIKQNNNTKSYSCTLQTGTYILVVIWYKFIVFGFLTPTLMIIFGIRTIINIRRVMINPMSRLYSIDRQLILIMLSQCFIHVIFRLPLLIYLIFDYITKNSVEDIRSRTLTVFFYYISLICFYIPYCCFFFVNLISHSFYAEFKRLIIKLCMNKHKQRIRKSKKRRHQRVYPIEIIQRSAPIEMTLK